MATVVAFHAHPDDEVLLTGGTIARLASEGHRVIVVVACDGDVQNGPDQGRRLEELRASAAILGADRAVHLGYADSGHGPVLYEDPPGRTRFARADPQEAARRLAALLTEENADLLLSYDPQGGYGHRDHVRVHQVGARAAGLAGVRVVEATVPRELVARVARLLVVLRLLPRHRLEEMRGYGMPQSMITHRIDVRRHAARKRAALAAHRTPASGKGRPARLFHLLIRSPLPVFRAACGTEWFAEPGGRTGELIARDHPAVPDQPDCSGLRTGRILSLPRLAFITGGLLDCNAVSCRLAGGVRRICALRYLRAGWLAAMASPAGVAHFASFLALSLFMGCGCVQ
jgi:LmbE family N-acetylglucosaminyl deacetylase